MSNAALPTTLFIMPGSNTIVTAVFTNKPPPQFQLTVANGTGSGSYTQDTLVTIAASNAPAGQYFAEWIGGAVSNATAPLTFLFMPAMDTTVTAIYSNVPPIHVNALSGPTSNTFTISAMGVSGLTYSVLASTNLSDTNGWVLVGTVTAATDGAVAFPVPTATLSQRFFKLRSQ